MVEHRVEEYHLWGKGELEDMLFLPKNDHLLFAYFGISLHVRRRSLRTELQGNLTLKRRLVKLLGSIRELHREPVLIRDPRDDRYPVPDRVPGFLDLPPWRYWEFERHQPIDCVMFVFRKCFGYADWNTGQWDALTDCDVGIPQFPDLCGLPHNWAWNHDREKRQDYNRFWTERVPKDNQAWYYELKYIPYRRILAVDELGDLANEGPHLLVEYRNERDPFEERTLKFLRSARPYDNRDIEADPNTHITFFPDDVREQAAALELQQRESKDDNRGDKA